MGETVLVTGATGLVGGWCAKLLLEQGYAVRATLRSRAKEGALRAAVGAEGEAGGRLSVHEADLMDDAGWAQAMAGVDYVLHVASPLGDGRQTLEELIGPARDGALRVLKAASAAGVKRVVMTSAAATARPPRASGLPSDESVWADPADPQFDGYRQSKILAERAAWEFMEAQGGATALTTVLPGAVFGPILSREAVSSVGIVRGLMHGRPARLPRFGFWVVDVRDLADLHIRAMTAPQAAGQRFLGLSEFMWMEDVATALREGLGAAGAKVPIQRLPNIAYRIGALFSRQMRYFLPDLNSRYPANVDKARKLLGWAPRSGRETVIDCGRSLAA